MKKSVKFILFVLVVLIVLLWAILSTERKKEEQPEPPAKIEQPEPAAPALPQDPPKGEKILMMTLPAQDTTVVFKLNPGDVVKMSEIRNENNAVLIWTSERRNFYQIILRDRYSDWVPNVEGGVFKLKNGRKLTVKFEN